MLRVADLLHCNAKLPRGPFRSRPQDITARPPAGRCRRHRSPRSATHAGRPGSVGRGCGAPDCVFTRPRPDPARGASHSKRVDQSINLLLIPDAQYVIAQQYLLVCDLIEECARNVARVNDALWPSRVVENRYKSQGPCAHGFPYGLQCLVHTART